MKEDSKTAKCPTCGTKYLKATGYCLKCQKKVGKPVKKKETLTKDHLINGAIVKKDSVIMIEATESTKVYPVSSGANSYRFNIGEDSAGENSIILNGEVSELADKVKAVFGANVSVTEITNALEKHGRGAYFEVFRNLPVTLSGFRSIE